MKEVSRSFYLTLRMLPAEVREVISVGYLLARASDTMADTAEFPVTGRVECLELFLEDFSAGRVSGELQKVVSEWGAHQSHAGERELMRRLPEVMGSVRRFSEQEQECLQVVIREITAGQRWDLNYFGNAEEITRVRDDAQLLAYTYQVAGCVGEFWTDILCLHELASEADRGELRQLGKNYGMGLQLTNIVRDAPEDFANGRVYLPGAGTSVESVIAASDGWITQAEDFLKEGLLYAGKLPRGRLRLATVLPAKLGLKTLALLSEASPKARQEKVKVSRAVVFWELLKAVL